MMRIVGLFSLFLAVPALAAPNQGTPPTAAAPDTSAKGDIPVAPNSPLAREPLGDALFDTDGRIPAPHGVDPKMTNPTPPDSDRTPVIPPPGSPGGNPNVEPK